MFKRQICLVLSMVLCFLALSACRAKNAEYTLSFTGSAEDSGVIYFLDYSINVYKDEASNPCGTCADQPVHLYVGASAQQAAEAVAEVIERADDLWDVASVNDGTVVLIEREKNSVSDFGSVSVVNGLSASAKVDKGSVSITLNTDTGNSAAAAVTAVNPQRIASLYGPSYEMLMVLGAEDKIVVRADVQTDSFPWAETVFSRISDIPYLDNVHSSVNFEELMRYSPDLVFTFPRQNELNQLSQAGVAAVAGASYLTLDDTCNLLNTYADALGGEAVERAAEYCAYFNGKLSFVQDRLSDVPENEKPTVYYAGMDVLTTYGAYSDMIEAIEAAGGVAVTKELKAGSRTEINYEQLMDWNPEYIFLDHGGINDGITVEDMREELYTSAAYSAVAAVIEKNVFTVPSGVFYWDMGLQKILLIEYMAKTLYPELFEELDMREELMEFYSTFYDYDLTQAQAEQILSRQMP